MRRDWLGRAGGSFLFLLLCLVPLHQGRAIEEIVTNTRVGFALEGYDPVAYFISGKPVAGKWGYEATWRGVSWRFVNIGNRDAFLKNPTIYAPQFGGHGAMAVARGYAAEGNPHLWSIEGERLYLFYSKANQVIWQQDKARYIRQGRRQWRKLIKEARDPKG